jgi:putative transposase
LSFCWLHFKFECFVFHKYIYTRTQKRVYNMSKMQENRNHSAFMLFYHFIFVVKYRKKLLSNKKYDDLIKRALVESQTKNIKIEKMESDQDHIHVLVSCSPNVSPVQIASILKQKTTYELWETYESELKKEFWKEHKFWSPSYFVCSIGSVTKEAIERYISNQRNSTNYPKG